MRASRRVTHRADHAARRAGIAVTVALTVVMPAGLPATAPDAAAAPATVAAPSTPSADDSLAHTVREAAERAAAAPARTTVTEPELRDELDAAVTDLVAQGAVGVTARVDTPSFTWTGADGVRALGSRVPARATDQFRAGSITKPMIATLVLQEIERGTWTLDTSVRDVLPGALARDVTVEQLLSHTSGAPSGTNALIADHMQDPDDFDEFFEVLGEHYSEADHVRAAHAEEWRHEPGTGHAYSNAGFVTLGMMLEKVTGHDLADLLEERVFEPAGMRRSDYPVEPGTRGPFLHDVAYTGSQGAGWYGIEHTDPSVFHAAGAVTSTTQDLAAFTEALATGALVRPETVTDMFTPRGAGVFEYGLGTFRVPDPCVPGEYLYGHDGATFGTLSVALTSRDGGRQVTLAATGRNLSGEAGAPVDLMEVTALLMEATC